MVMNFYDQIAENKKMTYVLFGAFFLLIGVLAFLFSYLLGGFNIYGLTYFTIFGILTIIFALISYFSCDSIVAAVSGAKEVSKDDYRQLYNVTEELSLAGGVPMPRIFVINDSTINAFATGRDPEHAIICVTTGCLDRLTRDELQGVVAHELSHIKNYDIRTMTIATVLVGVAVLLSDVLLRFTLFSRGSSDSRDNKLFIPLLIIAVLLAALTPLIANLIKLSISRKREFMADASAVELTRNPLGLANALEKISNDEEPLEAANKATAHMYISDPLKNTKGMWFKNMFNTHPPIEERINALKGIKN
ncbi:MAG: M48 family metallopeptidase [Candidatus Iainarchaeum sp.]|jgi:heat shock protein HtpX